MSLGVIDISYWEGMCSHALHDVLTSIRTLSLISMASVLFGPVLAYVWHGYGYTLSLSEYLLAVFYREGILSLFLLAILVVFEISLSLS